MKKYFALAAMIAVPFLGSCGMWPVEPPIDPYDPPSHDSTNTGRNLLAGTAWVLNSYETADGMVKSVIPEGDAAYVLDFGHGDQLGGMAACNSYGGAYKAQDAALYINDVVVTQMLCSEEDAQLNQIYFEALGGAQAYTREEDKMSIYSRNGSALHFTQLQTMGR